MNLNLLQAQFKQAYSPNDPVYGRTKPDHFFTTRHLPVLLCQPCALCWASPCTHAAKLPNTRPMRPAQQPPQVRPPLSHLLLPVSLRYGLVCRGGRQGHRRHVELALGKEQLNLLVLMCPLDSLHCNFPLPQGSVQPLLDGRPGLLSKGSLLPCLGFFPGPLLLLGLYIAAEGTCRRSRLPGAGRREISGRMALGGVAKSFVHPPTHTGPNTFLHPTPTPSPRS